MIIYRVQWRNLNRKDSKIHLEYILNNNNLSHSRCSSSKKGENSPWRNRYSDQNTLAIHYPKPWKTCSKILQPSKTANPQDPPYLFRPSLYHHFGTKSRIFQAREGRWGKIFRDWPRQGTRPEGGNRNQPLFVATSCHLSAPVRPRKGVETGGWTDGGCRSPVEGVGERFGRRWWRRGDGGGESESKESKELFQASPSAGKIELLFRSGVFLLLRISSRVSRTHSRTVHEWWLWMRAAKKFAKPCYPGMRVRGGGSPVAYRGGGNIFSSTNAYAGRDWIY